MLRRKKKKTSFDEDPRPLCNFTFVIRNATNLPNTDAVDLSASHTNVADPYCTFEKKRLEKKIAHVLLNNRSIVGGKKESDVRDEHDQRRVESCVESNLQHEKCRHIQGQVRTVQSQRL